MWTLVLNSGSSSLKFAVIDPATGEIRLSGLAERLGAEAASMRVDSASVGGGAGARQTHSLNGGSYAEAMRLVLAELDALGLRQDVRAVGHRVVHGGSRFSAPAVITPEVLEAVRECVPLAPLHNPANIAGIEAAMNAFPALPQVAVFDTAFHQTLPEVAYRYAVPEVWFTQHGVRRYGFHGISHAFVAGEAARLLGRPLSELKLITAHLGNGCSVTAVSGGRSVDSSMGLTPLEGLVMGTRSGNVDPGLHDYLARVSGLTLTQITAALNRESGLLALSGLTNDMRELEAAAARGHAGARLAVELFVYRLAQGMAAMAVALGRVDALVFTGGIGENSAGVRAGALARLPFLGLELDAAANAAAVRGQGGLVSTPGSLPALVIATNEEWMIARETALVLSQTIT